MSSAGNQRTLAVTIDRMKVTRLPPPGSIGNLSGLNDFNGLDAIGYQVTVVTGWPICRLHEEGAS